MTHSRTNTTYHSPAHHTPTPPAPGLPQPQPLLLPPPPPPPPPPPTTPAPPHSHSSSSCPLAHPTAPGTTYLRVVERVSSSMASLAVVGVGVAAAERASWARDVDRTSSRLPTSGARRSGWVWFGSK